MKSWYENDYSNEEIEKMKSTATKAIKMYCKLECCAGSEKEWRECNNKSCPLYNYRLGKNPNYKKVEISPEEKQQRSERLKEYHRTKNKK